MNEQNQPVIDYYPSVSQFTGKEITKANTVEYLRNTLDLLALALAKHDHQWTIEERKGYEQSMAVLEGMRQAFGG